MCIRDSLYSTDDNRLTKQFFKYLWGKKSTSSSVKAAQKNLGKNNIHAEKASKREVSRGKVLKREGVQGSRDKNAGSKWTDDIKKRHNEKVKEYWTKRKEQMINN